MAMDPSVGVAENESVRRWVVSEDFVVVRAVAAAVGEDGMVSLLTFFKAGEQWLAATNIEFALMLVLGAGLPFINEFSKAHGLAALALIEEHSLATLEAQKMVSLSVHPVLTIS